MAQKEICYFCYEIKTDLCPLKPIHTISTISSCCFIKSVIYWCLQQIINTYLLFLTAGSENSQKKKTLDNSLINNYKPISSFTFWSTIFFGTKELLWCFPVEISTTPQHKDFSCSGLEWHQLLVLVLLHLSAAFVVVAHNILLDRLED